MSTRGAGSDAQKKQLALSLQRSQDGAAADSLQRQGQGLPCTIVSVHAGLVTVAFNVSGSFTLPQVTCPVAESIYVLLPLQVGDKGFVTSASARLGGVTGQGAGLAPLSLPSNLGGLVFVPIGNKAWTTPDANAVVVQGPNGAIVRTMDGMSTVTISEDSITLNRAGKTVVIDDSGITLTASENTVNGNLTVNGNTTIIGDVGVTGDVLIIGGVIVTEGIGAATLAVTGLASVGSLSVGGKDFNSHDHEPGSFTSNGHAVTGTSGGVAP